MRLPHLSRDRSRSASRPSATNERRRSPTAANRIIGTTIFPNPDELPVSILKAKPVTVPPLPRAVVFEPLTAMRLSEPYE